ncbi:CPBP family intramembrane glutamic endopeptidase [Lacrimispora algidixylanolytica]|uniref:CAAX prenyl protease 2/Lysostaphin resistance protein A-like domain-containing protein n=1 Tax=Lacrimispora algidixylanolytica TaxID=94868 RepID=A0A419SZX5_9FIRM|nr:type II CAAX endopeptidase family protein [Lacrimispora algidixylanolytica]RKD30840.1 hypothetical protein BET01_05020 [Lacrimispora algidixylanolytica]
MMKKYIVTVIGISWLVTGIVFLNPETALNNFSVIMLIPLIITMIFNKADNKKSRNDISILKRPFNLKAMVFSCLYPIFFILTCGFLAVLFTQGVIHLPAKPVTWIVTILVTIFIGLFSALGEEYGWRGYLLPNLTKQYGKKKAVVITGLVWALYHIPTVYLVARLTGLGNPLLVCVVQAGVVFLSNFAFSYCYYLSGSVIPVIIYHSIWNTFNTALLGNLYTGKAGIIDGNIFLINGEGVLGLLLAIVPLVFFWRKYDNGMEREK